jgi:hypothetical protein
MQGFISCIPRQIEDEVHDLAAREYRPAFFDSRARHAGDDRVHFWPLKQR